MVSPEYHPPRHRCSSMACPSQLTSASRKEHSHDEESIRFHRADRLARPRARSPAARASRATTNRKGAVIGGVSGAAAGAPIGGDDNRLLGALIGGALGAGGGYLIGANKDKITGKDNEKSREEAIKASERAERNPAKAEDVDRARTADLNDDGFVTLDEVVAMRQANLSDREMIDRLERTDQVFELTDYQEDYLRTRGVSDAVIREMRNMNQDFARTASYDTPRPRHRPAAIVTTTSTATATRPAASASETTGNALSLPFNRGSGSEEVWRRRSVRSNDVSLLMH